MIVKHSHSYNFRRFVDFYNFFILMGHFRETGSYGIREKGIGVEKDLELGLLEVLHNMMAHNYKC